MKPRSCGSQPAHESLLNRRLGAPPPARRFAHRHRLRRMPETRHPVQGLDREHENRPLKNPRVYGRDVIRCAGVGKP